MNAIDREPDGHGRLFVGREGELARLEAWLSTPRPPTHVLSIRGMGGVGKTTLLLEMLRVAAARGAATYLIDGRLCGRTPAGFLQYLGTLAGTAPEKSLERLSAAVDAGASVLLAIDNYDDLRLLETWLRDDLLRNAPPAGVLVVLASRQGVSPAWLDGHDAGAAIEEIVLAPFSRSEAGEYIERLGLRQHPKANDLIRETGGHPLAVAVGAQRLEQWPDAAPLVSHAISSTLLLEAAAPELHEPLEALTILPRADEAILSDSLGRELPAGVTQDLERLSFVQRAEQGLALHDTARVHLLSDLRQRGSRYRRLRRRAISALRSRLAASEGTERHTTAMQLLSVCLESLPLHQFWDMSTKPDLLTPTPLQADDRPQLHAIVDPWMLAACGLTQTDEEHGLLDALCDRVPHCMAIYRAPDGTPLAFTANVLLHRETAALLENFRGAAIYLKQCPRRERAALDCPPERADTYWGAGFAAVGRDDYPASQLFGLLLYALLTPLTFGMRILGPSNSPDELVRLRALGFRVREGCEAVFGDAPWPFHVIELDLRERDFGAWAVSVFDALETGMKPSLEPGDSAVLEDLRAALDAIEAPEKLPSLALAWRLGLSGRELVALLNHILRADPPPPLQPEDQALILQAFPRRQESRESAALQRHVSRATYYRRLHLALSRLAQVLAGWEQIEVPGDLSPAS